MKTRLTDRYGVAHPFVGAGMAFICDTPDLCIAVCEAGGIGALAGSLLSPDGLAEAIDRIRAATDAPFHVNLLTIFPHADHIPVLVEKRVPIVSFHWGLPEAGVMADLRAAGIDVWAQVGSAADAAAATAAGCVAVVAQGNEAGGHNYGGMPTFVLVPAVRDAVGADTLVLAAGGIADGRGVAGALALGADGVWVGTRLVAATEANAHPEHQARIVAAGGEATLLSSVYGPENPGFNPMRLISNSTIEEWNHRTAELPANRSGLDPIGQTRFAGMEVPVRPYDAIVTVPETTGDFDRMPMLCGQGAGLIRDVQPTGEIVTAMMRDARAILSGLA